MQLKKKSIENCDINAHLLLPSPHIFLTFIGFTSLTSTLSPFQFMIMDLLPFDSPLALSIHFPSYFIALQHTLPPSSLHPSQNYMFRSDLCALVTVRYASPPDASASSFFPRTHKHVAFLHIMRPSSTHTKREGTKELNQFLFPTGVTRVTTDDVNHFFFFGDWELRRMRTASLYLKCSSLT